MTFTEHGTPVRGVNWVKPVAGRDASGKEVVYVTMGQQAAGFFVIMIDPQNGACTRISAELPGASYPTCAIWSERWQSLFVGTAWCAHLFRLHAATGTMEDCGPINEEAKSIFACALAEHPDGAIYIGSHQQCDLTSYRPDTGCFTHHGRVDPEDMYFYPMIDCDGTIAGLIKMTRPHVVLVDATTNTFTPIGPMPEAGSGSETLNLKKGSDGRLYIAMEGQRGLLRIEGEKTVAVSEDEVANLRFELAHQPPLYLPPQPMLSGGTVEFADRKSFDYRRLKFTDPAGAVRETGIDWQGDGTSIFFVHAGPDGNIYGSSVLPERLFRYEPCTGESVDFGQCSVAGGEAYAMANLDGKIYIVSYPGSRLSVYDPEKPYCFGTETGCNPHDLGRIDDVACRSHAMLAGPAGKVWIASDPDYGLWGGTLTWYDPETGEFGSHRHVINDASPFSLAWAGPGSPLLVGMSERAGTGAKPRAESVTLVVWDPETDNLLWQDDFGLPISHIHELVVCDTTTAYAVMKVKDEPVRLYLLDLQARKVAGISDFPKNLGDRLELPSAFRHGGHLYLPGINGIARTPLSSVDVQTWWLEEVSEGEKRGDGAWWQYVYRPITAPGSILENRYYYASAWRLRSLALPNPE